MDDGLDDIDLDSWADEETGSISDATDPTMAPTPLAAPQPLAGTGGTVDVNAVLRDAILPLLLETRTTLIHFEEAHQVEIDEVVLAGGAAELGGLREWRSLLGVHSAGQRLLGPMTSSRRRGCHRGYVAKAAAPRNCSRPPTGGVHVQG